jgi:carbon monoxide dehydrogenase subunit G
MKVSGSATMHAPAGEVWAALTDPAVLTATIPGCDRLERRGPGSWQFALSGGIASNQGTFTGEATVSDREEPASITVSARAAGGPGTVTATVRVELAQGADGTTELSYDAEATVGGQLGSAGQRMLASAASRLATQFLTALDQFLTRNGAIAASPAGAARPAPPQPAQAGEPALPEPATDLTAPSYLPGVLAGAVAGAVAGFVTARLIARRAR